MRPLIVIPARSGSKGLPGKNLLPLGGESLLKRAIETALNANCGSVALSTDCQAWLEMCTGWIHRVQRPAPLATDEAPSEWALLHALETLDRTHAHYDAVVMVQCTTPFTTPEDIQQCVARLATYACSLTVTPFHGFLWTPNGPKGWGAGATGINHSVVLPRQRRQERAPEYLETGGVYAMRRAAFEQYEHRFCGPVSLVEVPRWRALEIDTQEDYELAQCYQAHYVGNKKEAV